MRENCERARTHLQALESGRRMILPDGKGGETFLEDASVATKSSEPATPSPSPANSSH
jgi:hypothetical protein